MYRVALSVLARTLAGLFVAAFLLLSQISLFLLSISPASAQEQRPVALAGLADLSLEDLADIQITSVSRREISLIDAPADIFVISADDIRRSGVTTIPEALRLAPTLHVARMSASNYAISSRGFNSSAANKLLVLIDGRTVYTPLYSGVFWDAQHVMLEDIDRIEVINGPGATLWGANAVNGVINIITRSSSATTGGLVSGDVGDDERGVNLRYGRNIDDSRSWRVYGKFRDTDNTLRGDSTRVDDQWHIGQVGFRTDLIQDNNNFTLQGDAYTGKLDNVGEIDSDISGINVLGRWTRELSTQSSLNVQSYIDHTERDIPGSFSESLTIVDVELQHSLIPIPNHQLIWGGGYRHGSDEVGNTAVLAFLPANRELDWGNLFLQDDVSMLDDRLTLTVGVKADYNSYTHFEYLPSVRLAWKPRPEQLIWGALSRAVRAPSRIDREIFAPGEPPYTFYTSDAFKSEISKVLEIGYRAQPIPNALFSITLFHSEHDRLRSQELTPSGLTFGNKLGGSSNGIDFTAHYQPRDWWQLTLGGFYLDQNLTLDADSQAWSANTEGNDPDYQWTIRSEFDLPGDLSLGLWLRHVGKLPEPNVPAYTDLNAHLTWLLAPNLEISLRGDNLLHQSHPEFVYTSTLSEVGRSVRLSIRWDFGAE